jgi:hypothetical protein
VQIYLTTLFDSLFTALQRLGGAILVGFTVDRFPPCSIQRRQLAGIGHGQGENGSNATPSNSDD